MDSDTDAELDSPVWLADTLANLDGKRHNDPRKRDSNTDAYPKPKCDSATIPIAVRITHVGPGHPTAPDADDCADDCDEYANQQRPPARRGSPG